MMTLRTVRLSPRKREAGNPASANLAVERSQEDDHEEGTGAGTVVPGARDRDRRPKGLRGRHHLRPESQTQGRVAEVSGGDANPRADSARHIRTHRVGSRQRNTRPPACFNKKGGRSLFAMDGGGNKGR